MNLDHIYQEYSTALCNGDRHRAMRALESALHAGIDVRDVYLDLLQPAMYEIGQLWESGEITVAEEHMATSITQGVMAQLYNHAHLRPPLGLTMVATCVGEELHDLGIRMVADFFVLEGWKVFYLGANMPARDVVWLVNERKPDLLAISATLTTHLLTVRDLIRELRASPCGARLKVMVGGRPFNSTADACTKVGANFTARDAREAVLRAMQELGAQRGG